MLFTSDKESETLLNQNGISQTIFNGDTRYDRMFDITKEAKPNEKILQFKNNTPLLILGSSYREEENLALSLLQSSPKPKLKILIAPHHIDEKRIQEILDTFKHYGIGRYTQQESVELLDIIVLDTIGMLSSAYQYGDFALVGGGFSGALHNIIEPAFWGCALFFGPKFSKFPEATEMIDKELADIAENEEKWIAKIHYYLNNSTKLNQHQQNISSHCKEKTGSTDIIIKYFEKKKIN
jgi:3-deoxy-D-manno-octulosonic-acid transferase